MKSMESVLEKFIWTTADFNQMSWHDCPIHAMAFDDSESRFDDDGRIMEFKGNCCWILITCSSG